MRLAHPWRSFSFHGCWYVFNKETNKLSRKLFFQNNTFIIATNDHRFFINQKEIKVIDLNVGDRIDSENGFLEIVKIEEIILEDTYEIFNATNHVILANKINSHQCDEFAYVEPNIAVEFWTSISPTLATGGKAIITSTPNSDEDQFAKIWNEANKLVDENGNITEVGRNGFFPYKAIWNQHPDRDEIWAETEKSRVGEELFRREHACEFLVFDETLINSICLHELEGIDPIMKMGQVRWYKKINPHSTYVFSLDPSMGTGGDYAAIQVIELPSLEQVAEWHHNSTPIAVQAKIFRDVIKYVDDECKRKGVISSLYYSVENNTIGESAIIAITELGEDSFPGLFLSEPIKKGHVRRFRRGFNTTHSSKISTCSKLKQIIENKQLKINSRLLISELKSFIAAGITFKAKTGLHDDLVSSLLLSIRMIMLLQDWDPAIYEKLRENVGLEEYDLPMPIYINSFT